MYTHLCIPSDHIELKHLIEDSSSILHAPTFCIHVNQAAPPHKDISLTTTCNDLLMNTPTILELAHELSTRTKVNWDWSLIAAFVGKAPLSLRVAEPWHILQAFFYSIQMIGCHGWQLCDEPWAAVEALYSYIDPCSACLHHLKKNGLHHFLAHSLLLLCNATCTALGCRVGCRA